MPLILGVTGSIACGKSALCQRLVEQHGAIHVDADKQVHGMYEPGKPAFDRIVAEFGEEVVGEDGFIDRRVLGAKTFGQPERMAALGKAIGDIEAELLGVLNHWHDTLAGDQIAVLEAVNLFEGGRYAGHCHASWLVATDDETALQRLMTRNNFSREEAVQRFASARDWQERAPAADRVFHNDGTLEEFLAAVDAALQETLGAQREGALPEVRWLSWEGRRDRGKQAKEQADAEA